MPFYNHIRAVHMYVAAAVDRRKSTPSGPVAASHWPVVVHVIQDGGRQVRCARLPGDVCDVTSDVWCQLTDVECLDVEDAGDQLIASLTRHAADLACLQSLSVTWTPMKVVPGSWTRSLLPRLISVSLTRNQLRSVDGIEAASRLESLNISNNLIDSLPRHFGRSMPHLTSLSLTGNGLRSLPDSIGRLSQLQSLECAANKLVKLPSSVADLSELTTLDISSNNIVSLPDNIGQLAKLQHLRASANKLSSVRLSVTSEGHASSTIILRRSCDADVRTRVLFISLIFSSAFIDLTNHMIFISQSSFAVFSCESETVHVCVGFGEQSRETSVIHVHCAGVWTPISRPKYEPLSSLITCIVALGVGLMCRCAVGCVAVPSSLFLDHCDDELAS